MRMTLAQGRDISRFVCVLLLSACTSQARQVQRQFALAHDCKDTLVKTRAQGDALWEVSGCGDLETWTCQSGPCAMVPPPPASSPSTVPEPPPTEHLWRTVHTRKATIDACIARAKANAPQLTGRLFVAFTIEANGKVSNVSVPRTTVHDQTLEVCIAREVEQLHFPSRDEAMNVSYPFEVKQ